MFTANVIKPKTLKSLWQEIEHLSDNHGYVAGGTDLCAVGNACGSRFDDLIDISDLKELKGVKHEDGLIIMGGGEKIGDLERNEFVKQYLPAFAACFASYASPSLRNMATLGGNIANASPSADAVCALIAEGANIVVENKGKQKTYKLEEIFTGPKQTILKKDDLIVRVEVATSPHKGYYSKLANRELFAISKVNIAVCLWQNGDVAEDIKIALGAVGPTVIRAVKTEHLIKAKKLTPEIIEAAGAMVINEISPIDDVRSTAQYRKAMTGVMLKRILEKML